MATMEEVEGESEEGDTVEAVIKFLDDDGKVTKEVNRQFVIGDNVYCKNFNNKMTGIKAGTEVKTKLFTKSQKSEDEDIGENIKDREFLVEVKSIKRKILPELNDEFAKDLEYESVEEMRKQIEIELKKKLENDNEQEKKSAILNKLVEENPVEVPKSMVKYYAEQLAKPYAEAYKIDIEKIAPIYQQNAENDLKSHLIMQKIIEIENPEVTEKDMEITIEENAANMNMDVEKYKKMYKKQIESDDFQAAIKEKKIIKIIEESSKFVPLPKEEEKKEDNKEEE
jgi:trigger factor